MRIRPLLYLTAFVAAILGATVVYLVLSVPNDIRADALLKAARQDMTDGNDLRARDSLAKVVQQYPRTDAAAAATVALASLAQKESDELARAVELLLRQNRQQAELITALQKSVEEIRTAPPKVTVVTAPPPKPEAKKSVTPKKKTSSRRTTRRRRR